MQSCLPDAAIGTNVFTHAYDEIGNHVLGGVNAETNAFVANCLNQRVSARCVQPSSFNLQLEYTADGGLASDGRFAYAYDAEDRLVSVTSLTLTNGAVRVRNAYDWRSRRVAKCVDRYDAAAEAWRLAERHDFVWGNWNIVHESVTIVDGVATNVSEVQYFWGPDLSGTLDGAGGVGGLLAVSRDGRFYFPVYDNNGNVMKYVDESGSVVAAYVYDDFGATIACLGPLAGEFFVGFSTKFHDRECGLLDYGVRFYNPFERVWQDRDQFDEDGGLNLYGFCNNNPIAYFDVLGNMPAQSWDNHYDKGLMDAVQAFFSEKGGTFNYYYPDSPTRQLLQHPELRSVWREFEDTSCKGTSDGCPHRISYTAPTYMFLVDIVSIWGLLPSIGMYVLNMSDSYDFGNGVLGSFTGHWKITVDCKARRKHLSMYVFNALTTESLTRGPLTRRPYVTDTIYPKVDMHFYYEVDRALDPK